MLNRLVIACRRQILVWKLAGLQSWRDELSYSAQKVREAQARNVQEIGFVTARLAKLDGESMLMGEARKDDEGAVAMAISVDSHRVRLEFPKPVKWIACTADEAAELAMTIMYHARKLGLTKPVKIEL